MERKSREFIDAVIMQSSALKSVYTDSISYWQPEEPPITVLFGDLGKCIADHYEKIDPQNRQRIFSLIESAMRTNDELGTAVSTGLIEAIVIAAERDESTWKRMKSSFGEESLRYVEAWNEQTRDLNS